MTKTIQNLIKKQLGKEALKTIMEGSPEFIGNELYGQVIFCYQGQECEYYLDTSHPLIRQVEADKEFTDFQDLLDEIDGENDD